MYIDVMGHKGTRNLKGTSGKTYGNVRLFTASEITAMLADGISEAPAPSITEPTLEKVKDRKTRQISGERERRLDELTVTYNSVDYDANDNARANITSTVSAINAGITVPDPVNWRDANNVTQTLTHVQLTELAGLMLAEVQSIYETSWTLKAQIDAAVDAAAVDAIVWA